MTVTVSVAIPDEILNGQNGEMSRRILEEFALAGFQSGQLSTAQVRRILGYQTRMQVHAFLAQHGVPWVDYSPEEARREVELLEKLLPG